MGWPLYDGKPSDNSKPSPDTCRLQRFRAKVRRCEQHMCHVFGPREHRNLLPVNDHCGSIDAMRAFAGQIEAHERQHEAGLNACLNGTKARSAMADMEGYNGADSSVVGAAYRDRWERFYQRDFSRAGSWAEAATGANPFWYYRWWLTGVNKNWRFLLNEFSGPPTRSI